MSHAWPGAACSDVVLTVFIVSTTAEVRGDIESLWVVYRHPHLRASRRL
jgi:hypothetical protein